MTIHGLSRAPTLKEFKDYLSGLYIIVEGLCLMADGISSVFACTLIISLQKSLCEAR